MVTWVPSHPSSLRGLVGRTEPLGARPGRCRAVRTSANVSSVGTALWALFVHLPWRPFPITASLSPARDLHLRDSLLHTCRLPAPLPARPPHLACRHGWRSLWGVQAKRDLLKRYRHRDKKAPQTKRNDQRRVEGQRKRTD